MYLEMNEPGEGGELPHLYNVRSMTSSLGTSVPDAKPVWNNLHDPALTYIMYGCNVVNSSEFVRTPENMKKALQERDCTNGNASDFGYVKWAEAVLRKQHDKAVEHCHEDPLHLYQRNAMFTMLTLDEERAVEAEPMQVSIPFNSRYKLMASVHMILDPISKKMRPAVLMKGAAEQVHLKLCLF